MRRLGQLLCWLLLFWQPWAVMAQAIPALDPANAFVTRWRCDAGQEVKIPLYGRYSYEWVKLDGSGQPVPGTSVKGEATSTENNPLRLQAPTEGKWRLLAGPEGVKSCEFSKTHSRESLLLVEKWGSVRWKGLSFSGCLNMNVVADAGVPDLSGVSDLYNLFNGCSEMTRSLADWDLSTIKNYIDLSYCGMDEATYSATLEGWAAKKDQLQHGVAVSADRLHYNAAGKTARQELIDAKGWVFDGDLAPIEPLDPSHAYITRWRCDAGQELKIPLYGRYSYEWVKLDGSGQPVASTSVKGTNELEYLTLTAPTEGEWRLLAGPAGVERFTVPGLKYPDVTKMLARSLILVEKWGSVRWTSMEWAYALCASMNIAADAGVPDLSKVYTLYGLFTDCKQMNRSLADWDLSTITRSIGLSNCGMDEANYSATLVGWAAQKDRLQSGVKVYAGELPYNEAGKKARQELIDAKGWSFSGDIPPAGILTPSQAFITRWRCAAGQTVEVPLYGRYSYEWVKLDGSGQPVASTSVKGVAMCTKNNLLRLRAATEGEWRLLAGPEGVNSCDFDYGHNGKSLLLVEKWGSVRWEILSFRDCSNMNIAADAGVPDLSRESNLYDLFSGCKQMNRSLADWDLSTITRSIGLSNCGMDEATYSATLVGWAAKKDQLKSGVNVEAEGLSYNALGKTARQELIDVKRWSFTGDYAPIEPLDPANAYITRWRCDAGQEVKIPLEGRYSYEWVKLDGSGHPMVSTSVKGVATSTANNPLRLQAPTKGEWRLLAGPEGVGECSFWYNHSSRENLLLVEKWGSVRWKTLIFQSCSNMNIATDAGAPDLSGVKNLSYLFNGCKQMNRSLADWDLSTFSEGIGLSHCGMDVSTYSATLVGWAAKKDQVQKHVRVAAEGLMYNAAGKAARQELIDAKYWSFWADLEEPKPLDPTNAYITRWRCDAGQEVVIPLYGGYSYEWVKLDGSGQPVPGTSVKGVVASTINNPLRLQAPTEGEWRLLAGPEGVTSCMFESVHSRESLLLVEKWGSVKWERLIFFRLFEYEYSDGCGCAGSIQCMGA